MTETLSRDETERVIAQLEAVDAAATAHDKAVNRLITECLSYTPILPPAVRERLANVKRTKAALSRARRALP